MNTYQEDIAERVSDICCQKEILSVSVILLSETLFRIDLCQQSNPPPPKWVKKNDYWVRTCLGIIYDCIFISKNKSVLKFLNVFRTFEESLPLYKNSKSAHERSNFWREHNLISKICRLANGHGGKWSRCLIFQSIGLHASTCRTHMKTQWYKTLLCPTTNSLH